MTITIRQCPNDVSEAIGLAKHNRSRLPGTSERLQVAVNTDGRYITGLDEKSFVIKDEATKEKVKAKREALEATTGKDLSGTSEFWSQFLMTIPSDEDLVLNTENPMDEVKYRALIANGYVAPDFAALSNPGYKDANYYCHLEAEAVKEDIGNRKTRDKAIGKLGTIAENKNRMVLVGQFLEGAKYDNKLDEDTLYKMLREYIEQKDLKFAKLFNKALDVSTEDIQRKMIIDAGFKKRLIKKVNVGPKKSVYQFGQVTLGGTIEEVYTNLGDAKFSNELLTIQAELEK